MIDERSYQARGRHAGILNDLGQGIVGGRWPEGVSLPRETELQQHYGASRQSVREALRVLAAKGVVYARKRAGTFVTPKSEWNYFDPDILAWHAPGTLPDQVLRDLIEVRRLIEPAAAELAALRHSPESLARIQAALGDMNGAQSDAIRFYGADIRFHLAIFAASGNALIDRMSTILRPLLEASFRIQQGSGIRRGLDEGYEVHARVCEAICAREAVTARTAMQALLSRALSEVDHSGDPPDEGC